MTKQYTFLRTVAGRTFFARVTSRATKGSRGVHDSTRLSLREGNETITEDTHADWLHAAISGADDALQHGRTGSDRSDDVGIEIIRVVGSESDTTPDAIRCAAAFAAWEALGGSTEELEIRFEEPWKVIYPT